MSAELPHNTHPAASLVPTPTTFDEELCALVVDEAPRMFAVVQVCDMDTGLANGWVVAWGIAYEDGTAHVVSADGRLRMSVAEPERATRPFSRTPGLDARLVWLAPSHAAALDGAEAA